MPDGSLRLLACVAVFSAACSSLPAGGPHAGVPADRSVLTGWRRCTDDNCGRNFVSVYSTFVFLRVDDLPQGGDSTVTVAPGRHWIEAHHAWGAGVVAGVGNWRNYAFELDFLPGHRYSIGKAPSGCLVPASRHWVSPKKLRVLDLAPSGEQTVREVEAMELCTPSSEETGTCRQDGDCPSGTCTPFGGTTGYGLCGTLRR